MSLPVRDAAGAVPGRGEGGFTVAAALRQTAAHRSGNLAMRGTTGRALI